MRLRVSPLLPLLLAAATACAGGCAASTHEPLPPTQGAWFYEECGPACLVADFAMASGGAVAHVRVPRERIAAVRSTAPSLVEAQLNGELVELRSGLAGVADLQLLDPAGVLVDHVPVSVAATHALGFAVASMQEGTVAVLQGSAQRFHVNPQDAWGYPTIGYGSIAFHFEGPLAPLDSALYDGVQFAGTAPGTARVVASTPAPTPATGPVITTLPVLVVDPADLVALDAVVHAGDPADPADATVEVTARTANGPVYGAACDWSTEPAVSVAWQAVAAFDQPARSTTHFRLEADGRFTARCVVGNITTSVSLHR